MSNRVTPDNMFMVTVRLNTKNKAVKESHLDDIEIPVVVAKDAHQAEILAKFAVRAIGLEPTKEGHTVRQLTPHKRTKHSHEPPQRAD